VVVEPGQRAIQTAHQIRRLASDLGVKAVYVVGNKVTDPSERRLIEEGVNPMPVLGHLSYSEAIRTADREGVSPYDLDQKLKAEVAAVYGVLERLADARANSRE
jgi:CO dehydrogenase maturation factor